MPLDFEIYSIVLILIIDIFVFQFFQQCRFLFLRTVQMRKSEKREKRKERPKLLFLAEHWHQPILHKTEGQHKKDGGQSRRTEETKIKTCL